MPLPLPFTVSQFLSVFADYNQAVFPLQFALPALGVALVPLSGSRHRFAFPALSIGLAFLWLWMGAVYHLRFFLSINPAARLFGIAFIVQGLLFLFWLRGHRDGHSFRPVHPALIATRSLRRSGGPGLGETA